MKILDKYVPKVGLLPPIFPRDPIEVSVYLEHVLLGQVIEPLVIVNHEGNIEPGVASHWEISEDSKLITFHIAQGMKFSNGVPVTARDVKYSLDRHRHSERSQAKAYLRRIVDIVVRSESAIEIHLDHPYIAIFKALSRDQLGILPEGWTFNRESTEPFTGTGPYRAVRSGAQWQLVLNNHYRRIDQVRIPIWDLVFFDHKQERLADINLPDVVMMAVPEVAKQFEDRPEWRSRSFKKSLVKHFVQTSAWWYPKGPQFRNVDAKNRAMSAIADLLEARCQVMNFQRTTGIIPQGITGYLSEVKIPDPVKAGLDRPMSFTVSVLQREYDQIVVREDTSRIEREYNINLNFVKAELGGNISDTQPDVAICAYAGGFQDPEGFLTVITSFLNAELSEIFGDLMPLYSQASRETDWSKRHELYQKLNQAMVESRLIVPGWKPELYDCCSGRISCVSVGLSYILKLGTLVN